MKKLLVDLSALEDIYQGMGNIALNYGKHFRETYRRATAEYDLTLLVPKEYFGQFGDEVKYLSSSNWLRRHCRYFFPKFDIWRNLHHTSRFKPYDKSTIYIYTIHDFNCLMLEYEGTQKKVNQSYRRMMRHFTKADVVVAISNFVASQLGQFLDLRGKQVKMIYNGVEKIANDTATKPCGIDETKKNFFLSVSAFRQSKNFHLLLDMMKLMPDKSLYLVGNNDTEYGRMLRQRIDDEAIDNVHLTGKVSDAEKVWLYANCEAFLFPSSFEGFGLPVIEAMQFGKPVFSSSQTSLAEIGGKYAYFWDKLEPAAMKRLIDEKLPEFYANPQYAVEEKKYADTFSYKNHFEAYDRLYTTILNKKYIYEK